MQFFFEVKPEVLADSTVLGVQSVPCLEDISRDSTNQLAC